MNFLNKKYRIPIFLACLSAGLLLSGRPAMAFEHGYKRQTDDIYMVSRLGMTVYDEPGGEIIDTIPDFEGVVAIGEDGSWYEVRYTVNKKTHYGYVTKDEFNGSGLEYDGRDKQVIGDGNYRIQIYAGNNDAGNPFSSNLLADTALSSHGNEYTFTYVGNNAFHISRVDSGLFLCVMNSGRYIDISVDSADDTPSVKNDTRPLLYWGSEEEAASLVLFRTDNCYRIMDQTSMQYLGLDTEGELTLTTEYQEEDYTAFRLLRTRKAIKDSALRLFCQYDPDWAHYYYGKGDKHKVEHGNYSTSGCGALATFNAIYSVTGQLPDVFEIGNYAAETGYRIDEAGTDSGFFKVAAKKFGYKYGFAYDGSSESFDTLKKKLNKGDTAIVYLPGHYGAIVSYSAKKNKFLLLDSHKLPRRGTSCWGDWVSQEDLSSGDLYAQGFFFYRRIDDKN